MYVTISCSLTKMRAHSTVEHHVRMRSEAIKPWRAGVPRLRLWTRVRDLGTRLAPWPSPEFGFGHSLYIRKSVKFRDMQPTTALPCNRFLGTSCPEMLRLSAEDRGWDLLAQILYNKICGATLLWQLKHGRVIAVSLSRDYNFVSTVQVSPSALAQF